MTTVAPPNMVKALDEFYASTNRPASIFNDGIVGDVRHMSISPANRGYHVSAQDKDFTYGTYSLDYARDRAGGKATPTYASAHDIGGNLTDRITVTKRVLAAFAAKDPRLHGVAEFAGTTNGTSVHACYPNTWTDDPTNKGGWDAGHYQNHCHVSFDRDSCNDYNAVKAFLDIVAGVPAEGDDMTPEQADQLAHVVARVDQLYKLFGIDENGDGKVDVTSNVQGAVRYGMKLSPEFKALQADVAAIKAAVTK